MSAADAHSVGLVRTYVTGADAVTELELLESEGHVVCGSLEIYYNVIVVDLATGSVVATLSDPDLDHSNMWKDEGGITALAVSADHQRLMTCAEHESLVKVWDLRAGNILARLETPERVEAIVATTDPNRAVSIAGNEIQVWDLAGLRALHRIAGLPPTRMSGEYLLDNAFESLAVDARGDLAVAGDREGNLIVADLRTGTLIGHVGAHKKGVTAVAVDRTGMLALSGSWGADSPGIRLWRLPSPTSVGLLKQRGGTYKHLLFADDDVVVSTSGGEITTWNLRTRQPIESFSHPGIYITDIALRADGTAVTSEISGRLKLWSLRGTAATSAARAGEMHHSPVDSIAVSGDGRIVASSERDGGPILLWETSEGRAHSRVTGPRGRSVLQMLSDGQTVVAAGDDGLMMAWDLPTRTEVWRCSTGVERICALVSMETPSGLRLVAGDWNGGVTIWDPRTSACLAKLPRHEVDRSWRSHPGPVRSLALGRRVNELLVGTENDVEIWDLAQQQRLITFDAKYDLGREDHFVTGVAMLPDGRVLSACTNGTVLSSVVDPASGPESVDRQWLVRNRTTSLALARASTLFVVATRLGTVDVLDVPGGFSRLCSFVGDDPMLACAASLDGSVIAAGDDSGRVHILGMREMPGGARATLESR